MKARQIFNAIKIRVCLIIIKPVYLRLAIKTKKFLFAIAADVVVVFIPLWCSLQAVGNTITRKKGKKLKLMEQLIVVHINQLQYMWPAVQCYVHIDVLYLILYTIKR